MADSDEERGSDVEDDGEPEFDPASDLENMSEKQRKKWEKSLQKWKLFMNFLFRHVAIASYRYNMFESNDLTQFMISLEKAEALREQTKLKKGEVARITSYKVMKEASDLLLKQHHVNEANKIKTFLDIAGRLRGIGMIAGGFYKALKKGKVKGLDKIKYYLDYWKGFCVRSFDYNELQYRNADPEAFNALEKKFLIWPTTVRTCIHMSNRFLKRCSESTGIDLMDPDQKQLQKHMQPAEFVVATKIEELLNQRVTQETRTFALLGKSYLLMNNRCQCTLSIFVLYYVNACISLKYCEETCTFANS